ncbi:hypothetical protein I6J18_07945 [Peribacillus psychrosaccharolyticus]|uniref:Uncharacterized protein n=1 Tax=Peribacillus psychrosaccharolyticus TaxID=1407 RepID=A0A974NPR4_PERPY|nr:hypothetical protein [Peribacillus psychrosaccharolyticus]MEC2057509.1 hypothetical protein [Peribacillus psychrosaccharolyticus]MED3745964.1 hypothetical protein [Peribacillus psychrosaccharolyticus]QQT01774.1 hypothetical protein I6J18_07945 [Peribacillus psychrosaccharolyticus]
MERSQETQRELEMMFTEGLGRTLTAAEQEILLDVVAYPTEKRVAFLEMMKEFINRN